MTNTTKIKQKCYTLFQRASILPIFFCIFIVILYIAPTFIQVDYSEKQTIKSVYVGLPFLQSGDEPHYYITLFSLVNDKDIFLTNNYDAALYRNSSDLGKKKWNLDDRHTRLFDSENKTIMNIPFVEGRTLNLSVIPQEDSSIKEIPGHPVGLPLFALLFLWPLKNSDFLEPAAIYLTLLWSLLGIFAFYKILQHYHNNTRKALLFTALFAIGTQYWHYSKTFWAEPYLASFMIICWYLILNKNYFFAALLLGFGFLIKYPFLLMIAPLGLFVLFSKSKHKILEVITFTLPLLLSFSIVLFLNFFLTGHPLRFNQAEAVHFVMPLVGIMNWLINPTFGLLTHSPILIFSILGLRLFWKKNKAQCLTLISSTFFYFLFWASYIVSQTGGGGYSARYLLPTIPMLMLVTSFVSFKNRRTKILFVLLASYSVGINLLAAVAYPAFISESIFISITKIIQFMFR